MMIHEFFIFWQGTFMSVVSGLRLQKKFIFILALEHCQEVTEECLYVTGNVRPTSTSVETRDLNPKYQ